MRKNVAQLVFDRARSSPEQPAIQAPEFELTFDQLSGLVLSYAMHMARHGAVRGSTVAIKTADPVVVVVSALSAALLGCRWVSDGNALQRTSAVHVTRRFASVEEDQTEIDGAIPMDRSWSVPPESAAPLPMRFQGFASDADTWLIFPSSGTTGTPKFMAFSHGNILDRFDATAFEFPTGDEKCVFLFAVHSPPTLIRALCALTRGAGLILSANTGFWIEQGSTHVFASPSQIRYALDGHRLPVKISKVLIGGDFLPDEFARQLLESFDVVVNTYGSTEANMVVENRKTLADDGSIVTSTIWHDSEIEIVDENDIALPAGAEGVVRVRNGYLAQGYLNSPEAEVAAFRDGWFYPGDMGVISKDRNFTVTGRTNDTFNVGGIKFNAALMDYVLQSVPGVDDAVCFMMPDKDGLQELVALIKASPGTINPDVVSEARLQVAMTISAGAIPSKFVFSDVIPRTENGKPDRAACVAMAVEKRREGG